MGQKPCPAAPATLRVCSRIRFPAGSLMLTHPGGPQGLVEHLPQRHPSAGTDYSRANSLLLHPHSSCQPSPDRTCSLALSLPSCYPCFKGLRQWGLEWPPAWSPPCCGPQAPLAVLCWKDILGVTLSAKSQLWCRFLPGTVVPSQAQRGLGTVPLPQHPLPSHCGSSTPHQRAWQHPPRPSWALHLQGMCSVSPERQSPPHVP